MTVCVPIVILGAGGDALVVAEAVQQGRASGRPNEVVGFLDDGLAGQTVHGHRVLGNLDSWHELAREIRFIPAIQKVKDAKRRAERVERLGIPVERWVSVIHHTAVIASDVCIGHAAFIASGVTVQPRCSIGAFATLRAGAVLGHDCQVADHGYVGPNAVMCGRTRLARGAHLGPSSVLLDAKSMGEFSVSGIGAAVVKDVPANVVVFGNPAKRVGFVR